MAGMFVRYYLELPLAADLVEQALVDASSGWLASLSTAAQERGEGLAAPGRGGAGRGRRPGGPGRAVRRPSTPRPGEDAGSPWSSARRSTCPP